MKCENGCHGKFGHCYCCVECSAPLDCLPCTFCNSRDEMYCEIPVEGDWSGRGFVMRIGCLCPKSLGYGKDESRTEFEPYLVAIADWNSLMRERGAENVQ